MLLIVITGSFRKNPLDKKINWFQLGIFGMGLTRSRPTTPWIPPISSAKVGVTELLYASYHQGLQCHLQLLYVRCPLRYFLFAGSTFLGIQFWGLAPWHTHTESPPCVWVFLCLYLGVCPCALAHRFCCIYKIIDFLQHFIVWY